MIQLPAGFDIAALFSDYFAAGVPFISIAVTVAAGFLILRVLRRS